MTTDDWQERVRAKYEEGEKVVCGAPMRIWWQRDAAALLIYNAAKIMLDADMPYGNNLAEALRELYRFGPSHPMGIEYEGVGW
jgi:hypothetical protein